MDEIVGFLKDITQIMFWLTGSSIAFFSYRQAKRSIFQPAKNEVFKVQISALQSLMTDLSWRSSLEAWRDSGLEESAEMTLSKVFVEYAEYQFGVKIASQKAEHHVPVAVIVSTKSSCFELIQGPADEAINSDPPPKEKTNWEDYCWETFELGEQYKKIDDLLHQASSNPVLPLLIISKLGDLREEFERSAIRAAEDIEQAARQFTRHYPSVETLKGADLFWAHNIRKERGEALFNALIVLRKEIREYLKSDRLLQD